VRIERGSKARDRKKKYGEPAEWNRGDCHSSERGIGVCYVRNRGGAALPS